MIRSVFSCLLLMGVIGFQSQGFASEFAPQEESEQIGMSEEFDNWVSAELGVVWQSRNDIEIPKGSATRFSFLDFGTGPFLAGRVYVGHKFGENHEVRVLLAPLSLEGEGHLKKDTTYNGKVFLASQKTKGEFQFNSYRATYRYRFFANSQWSLKAGLTGKIRDAEIRLTQGNTVSLRSNVGFVPLLHFAAEYMAAGNFRVMFDADALAAPQGRAEDVSITLGYDILPEAQLFVGYRTVEGGADAGNQDGGGRVYNFTWLHYAVAGAQLRF